MEKENKKVPFLITISYLITFLTIRLMVIIAGSAESEFAKVAKEGMTPDSKFYIGRNIILFGHHIHHFYFGIVLIAIAGWIAIVKKPEISLEKLAITYGIGLGLFMDEIGLLLTWGDYYSDLTYQLSLLLGGIFLNIVFFPDFWNEVKDKLVKSNPHSVMYDLVFHKTNFIKVVDNMSDKVSNTEKASLVFSGVIYLCLGVLILLYPKFVYYWVAGAFLIQGVSSLVRAWKED
ncbi:MAG: hypothetical protein ACQERZ_03585 [Fusobacteriota bacterium]